ncbi:MAG: tetratricopeptide repeat protein [Muribaculaceae bacterium]
MQKVSVALAVSLPTPTAVAELSSSDSSTIALIERFSGSGASVELANRFMRILEQEELLDKPFRFDADTPVDSLRQQVWYWSAEWYYARQDYDAAERYATKALPLYSHDSGEKADCLNLLGIVNVRKGNFAKAVAFTKQTLAIDMRIGDPDRISSSLNVLAGTYMAAGNPTEAEKYILKGIEYADKADNAARKAILLGMASEVYHKLGDDSIALSYADSAYELDSVMGKTRRLPVRLSQRAVALMGIGRYAEAEAAYRTAIAGLRESGNMHSLAIDLNQLGMLLHRLNRSAEAIECHREAAAIFDRFGDLYNLVHSHKGLYESYWDICPDSARIELGRFNALKDSLYSQATAEALARYSAEFDNYRLRAESDRNYTYLVIAVVAAALLLVAFILTMRIVTRRHRRRLQDIIGRIEAIERAASCGAEPDEEPAADDRTSSLAVSDLPADDKFLNRVISAVEEGLATGEYGVARIASKLNISEQTFRRRVVEATGKSPKVFISAIQMERAARLLGGDRRTPINDIASACGFNDAETFSRAFKRAYGCSPSHYRGK